MANHTESEKSDESAFQGMQDFNSPIESSNNEPVNFEATQYVSSSNDFPTSSNFESVESFPDQGIANYSSDSSDNNYQSDSVGEYAAAADSIPNFESADSFENNQYVQEGGFQTSSTEEANNFEGNFEQENASVDGYAEQEVSDSSEAAPYDFNQPLGAIPQPHQPIDSDPSNLSDIAEFANSNEVTSGLSYSITIDGIENFALVKALREAMEDSKFGWDTNGLLESIQGGRLVVKRLSPVKASIFIGRIKYLPLTISWKQEVLGG